jgi:hypothetical protein
MVVSSLLQPRRRPLAAGPIFNHRRACPITDVLLAPNCAIVPEFIWPICVRTELVDDPLCPIQLELLFPV